MYFSRTGQPLDLVLLMLQVFLWGFGGYLLVRNVFRVHKREQIIVGFAAGLLLFMWGGNLLAQILPLNWALWITSGSLFLLGVGSEIKGKSTFRDLLPASQEIPLIIVTGVTFLIFTLINRGLAI
jgi:low affinity Fe/Cu permease